MTVISRRGFLINASFGAAIASGGCAPGSSVFSGSIVPAANPASPVSPIEGVTAVIVGVSDPVPHLRLWRDALGYADLAHGAIDARTAMLLYDVDYEIPVWSLAPAGATGGQVHLLQLPPGTAGTGGVRFRQTGPHSMDLAVQDFARAEAALGSVGQHLREPPRSMTLHLGAETYSVMESSLGNPPDSAHVQFAHIAGRVTQAWTHTPGAPFSEVNSLLTTVADIDAEAAFWTALGLMVRGDGVVQNETLEYWFELENKTNIRLVSISGTGSSAVLLAGFPDLEMESGPLRHIGRTLGISGFSIKTHSLDEAIKVARRFGALEAPEVQVHTPIHGSARIARIRTPGGIALELWQSL